MALLSNGEYYTKWTHVENGNTKTRRIHRMEVQARDGRLYIVTGTALPDFIHVNTGHGYKGEHLAQILLSPGRFNSTVVPKDGSAVWPNGRDLLHVVIGFSAAVLLKFIASLLVACL